MLRDGPFVAIVLFWVVLVMWVVYNLQPALSGPHGCSRRRRPRAGRYRRGQRALVGPGADAADLRRSTTSASSSCRCATPPTSSRASSSQLAEQQPAAYGGLTLAIGIVFVGVLVVLGREHELALAALRLIAVEGMLYAVAMRFAASYVVGGCTCAGAPAPPSRIGCSRASSCRSAPASTRKSRFACCSSASGEGRLACSPDPIPSGARALALVWAAFAARRLQRLALRRRARRPLRAAVVRLPLGVRPRLHR